MRIHSVVRDPGFPRKGMPASKGGGGCHQHLIQPIFYRKLHENEEHWAKVTSVSMLIMISSGLSVWEVPRGQQGRYFRSNLFYYRPQRSCEGYVFTRVCLSTGGVCLSACWDTTTAQSRHPQEQVPPPPPEPGTTSGAGTPLGAGTPRSGTPQEQAPPPSRRLVLRTVRILLEYILVFMYFSTKTLPNVRFLPQT